MSEPTATAIPQSLEDLRGKTPEELHQLVRVLDAHLRSLHQNDAGEIRDLDEAENRAFKIGLEIREKAMAMLEEHEKISEVFRRRPKSVERVYTAVQYGLEDPNGSVARMLPAEVRDRALRVLDSRPDTAHLSAPQKDQIDRSLRRDTDIARRIVVTENDSYRSAWQKMVTNPHAILSDEERQAMMAWEEYRAMSEGTTTAGGFGIPVFIDPSIILTAQESGNPFLQLARQVTVNTNAWKGVSSAGVTWAFQTEAAATTDNSPTLAQPTVNVYMARGFIPYSIEVGSKAA